MSEAEQEKQERKKYVATAKRYVENLERFLARVKRFVNDCEESDDGWVVDCDGISPWIEFERLISDAIYLREATWIHFGRDNIEL